MEEEDGEELLAGAGPGLGTFAGLAAIDLRGDKSSSESGDDDVQIIEDADGELKRQLTKFKEFLELKWNPERAGPIPSKGTVANHVRHVRMFAEFAREHGFGRLEDALDKPVLLSEFAAARQLHRGKEIMSSTLGSYLGSLAQLSDFLRSARGVPRWQNTSRWLANLSRQAQQYARIERVYGVGREESDWTRWDLQPFRVAALAEYFAHYDEDAREGVVTRANYVQVRAGWLRAFRAALLCLLLTPPVPRPPGALAPEQLADATSLSVQKNKTRALYGGQLLPLGRQPWPMNQLPNSGPPGFVRHGDWSSALDFLLLDLRERGARRGRRHGAQAAVPAQGQLQTPRGVEDQQEQFVAGRENERLARCKKKGWADLLTLKSSRKPAETMVRELEQFEVFTALGRGPPPWGAAGSGGAHLGMFTGAGQHSLDTVNAQYLLPGHRRRRVAEQAQWIEGMLNLRNWNAHVDDQMIQVVVSREASSFTSRFSEEGPRLEPLSQAEEKLRQQRRQRVRDMRGADFIQPAPTFNTAEEAQRLAPELGLELVGFQHVAHATKREVNAYWKRHVPEKPAHRWHVHQHRLSKADCKNKYNNDWSEVARLGVYSARNKHIPCLPPDDEGPRESQKYVCRFRVRDKLCGWPDRWLTVTDTLKEYGDHGRRRDKNPKLLMLMQAFLDQLQVKTVRKITGGVLVQWKAPASAPERTGPVVDSAQYPLPPDAVQGESAGTRSNPAACPDYWGPCFDRNWCFFRDGLAG
eukprot:g7938.t1